MVEITLNERSGVITLVTILTGSNCNNPLPMNAYRTTTDAGYRRIGAGVSYGQSG